MSEPDEWNTVFITADERVVLWLALQSDTANAVYEIVKSTKDTGHQMTAKIVAQMDWVWDVRYRIRNIPIQGGHVKFDRMQRIYLANVVDAVGAVQMSPEHRVLLAPAKAGLQMKLNDSTETDLGFPSSGLTDSGNGRYSGS